MQGALLGGDGKMAQYRPEMDVSEPPAEEKAPDGPAPPPVDPASKVGHLGHWRTPTLRPSVLLVIHRGSDPLVS